MRLLRLQVDHLRIVGAADLALGRGLNLILGPNGSGKTSLLEAIHLLATGRSFRTGAVDQIIRRGAEAARVIADAVDDRSGQVHRLGIERRGRGFDARIDRLPVATLTDLFAYCPALCFEPDSGRLIAGPGELRRRFLDWGLFHVEPEFLSVWRRFQRALRQRNLLLRSRPRDEELDAWDHEFAESGGRLHQLRGAYVSALRPYVQQTAAQLLPELGEVRFDYRPGWSVDEGGLGEALRQQRGVDRRLGYSVQGPQRAGWSLTFADLSSREQFSRGQTKLTALIAVLAQVGQFTAARGQPPIIGLDDIGAELDPDHQARVLAYLSDLTAQVILTAVDPGTVIARAPLAALFHVEQGRVTQAV